MPQPRAYLNLSSITGISRLDGRPQCFWGSHYEEPYDTYIVLMDVAILSYVVLFIVLVCFVLLNNGELVMLYMVIQPLIPVVERLPRFDQLGAAHHLDRLLYGAHPRCNPEQNCTNLSTTHVGSTTGTDRGDFR